MRHSARISAPDLWMWWFFKSCLHACITKFLCEIWLRFSILVRLVVKIRFSHITYNSTSYYIKSCSISVFFHEKNRVKTQFTPMRSFGQPNESGTHAFVRPSVQYLYHMMTRWVEVIFVVFIRLPYVNSAQPVFLSKNDTRLYGKRSFAVAVTMVSGCKVKLDHVKLDNVRVNIIESFQRETILVLTLGQRRTVGQH